MKSVDYYMELPDGMTQAEVRTEFESILDDPCCLKCPDVAVVAFSELSDRQWHTYELLDDTLRNKVTACLEALWLDDDGDRAESLFGIAGRLGLPRFLEFVKERNNAAFGSQVKRVVTECMTELEGSIADPYSGMN